MKLIMNIAGLCLSGMRALCGIITPNLRKVSIQEKDHIISVYFYYDHEPSEEEIDLAHRKNEYLSEEKGKNRIVLDN